MLFVLSHHGICVHLCASVWAAERKHSGTLGLAFLARTPRPLQSCRNQDTSRSQHPGPETLLSFGFEELLNLMILVQEQQGQAGGEFGLDSVTHLMLVFTHKNHKTSDWQDPMLVPFLPTSPSCPAPGFLERSKTSRAGA